MGRRAFLGGFGAGLLALPVVARAQTTAKVAQIGRADQIIQ
jgi:hypothetical protein